MNGRTMRASRNRCSMDNIRRLENNCITNLLIREKYHSSDWENKMTPHTFPQISTPAIVHFGIYIQTNHFCSSNWNWNECRRCSRQKQTSNFHATRPNDDTVVRVVFRLQKHVPMTYLSHRNVSNHWAYFCHCRRQIRISHLCMRQRCVYCACKISCEYWCQWNVWMKRRIWMKCKCVGGRARPTMTSVCLPYIPTLLTTMLLISTRKWK